MSGYILRLDPEDVLETFADCESVTEQALADCLERQNYGEALKCQGAIGAFKLMTKRLNAAIDKAKASAATVEGPESEADDDHRLRPPAKAKVTA